MTRCWQVDVQIKHLLHFPFLQHFPLYKKGINAGCGWYASEPPTHCEGQILGGKMFPSPTHSFNGRRNPETSLYGFYIWYEVHGKGPFRTNFHRHIRNQFAIFTAKTICWYRLIGEESCPTAENPKFGLRKHLPVTVWPPSIQRSKRRHKGLKVLSMCRKDLDAESSLTESQRSRDALMYVQCQISQQEKKCQVTLAETIQVNTEDTRC